jgi:hypothetical protein
MLWHEATPQGYLNHTRQQRRRSGGTVTNNFYGPSNFVQGNNHGVMSVSQNFTATPQELLSAMRQVLDMQTIPWNRPELAEVRGIMCQAVAKGDPSRAKIAIRKLRMVVEQLALSVAGNAAYQLLTSYFK